jgi:hypothetical protein
MSRYHFISLFAMRTLKSVLTCVLAVMATSCFAATNALEQAILSFQDIPADQFRPDQAVQAANILIRAGRSSACATLFRIAPEKRESQWLVEVGGRGLLSERTGMESHAQVDANKKVCHLCRLLFTSRNKTEPLRSPGLGAPMLVARTMQPENWPFLPFAISNDVPLSLTEGYTFEGGMPESARDYLTYCLSNGVFRTEPYPEPTFITTSNALIQVLTSPWWKAQKWNAPEPGVTWLHPLSDNEAENLKAFAAERLWDQVRNMANSASADSTNRLSRPTGSNR